MTSQSNPAAHPLAPDLAVFHDLNAEQANGVTCIVCQAVDKAQVSVGIAASTRSQVFAWEQTCAPLVGYVKPVGDQLELTPQAEAERPSGGNFKLPPSQPQVAPETTAAAVRDGR